MGIKSWGGQSSYQRLEGARGARSPRAPGTSSTRLRANTVREAGTARTPRHVAGAGREPRVPGGSSAGDTDVAEVTPGTCRGHSGDVHRGKRRKRRRPTAAWTAQGKAWTGPHRPSRRSSRQVLALEAAPSVTVSQALGPGDGTPRPREHQAVCTERGADGRAGRGQPCQRRRPPGRALGGGDRGHGL